MIEEMCELLANHYPFDAATIKSLYDSKNSWDMTIKFLAVATILGTDPLTMPLATVEQIYRLAKGEKA